MKQNEKPVVFIDTTIEDETTIASDAQEATVITIEHEPKASKHKRHGWKWWMAVAISTILALIVLTAGWQAYRYYYAIGVPVSVSPKENIAKLSAKSAATPGKTGITMTADSLLGVAIDLYDLQGLSASLTLQEPDTADRSVVLYSRSVDFTSTGRLLGSVVVDGEELQRSAERLGYCAMADGRMVIGVSRSERVMDYAEERGGSFFRQFILVSDGVLPKTFYLHGKVERRAIGRMPNDHLYYIVTRHKETLWDFADALREYGFVDAIYITGGATPTYYRTPDGQRHIIGDPAQPHKDRSNIKLPWLVFKAV